MAFTAIHPESADPGLLSEFVEQFTRLATNLGRADESTGDVLKAIDAAIGLQRRTNGPVTGLYRAKASYLRSEYTDSDQRHEALRAAIDSARRGSDEWANATIDLCGYQTDVSQYDAALRTVRELRAVLPAALLGTKYECAALVYEGVVLFTSFRDLPLAEARLRASLAYLDRAPADRDVGQWVAMAIHYLARLAEFQGRYRTSLDLYVQAQELADRSRELIMSEAFAELRIAEPLTAVGLYREARDHLDAAYALVTACSNRSSARLQVDLGYASLAAATGQPDRAVRIVEDAGRWARAVGFWRGELLCQGYLLALAIRRRRLWELPRLAMRILVSGATGELRRNGLLRLLIRLPVILRVAVRRMSSRRRRSVLERVTACPCQRHSTVDV